jgi:hypothetical protein
MFMYYVVCTIALSVFAIAKIIGNNFILETDENSLYSRWIN